MSQQSIQLLMEYGLGTAEDGGPEDAATAQGASLYTADELTAWRSREAAASTYYTYGSTQIGNWTVPSSQYSGAYDADKAGVIGYKNAYMASRATGIWGGPTHFNASGQQKHSSDGDADYLNNEPDGEHLSRLQGAALYALVAEDATVAAEVKTGILEQVAAVDFTDTTVWDGSYITDKNPGFFQAGWFAGVCRAIDYTFGMISEGLISDFSSAERTSILTWVRDGAQNMWQEAIDSKGLDVIADPYGSPQDLSLTGSYTNTWTTHDGGYDVDTRIFRLNNRISSNAIAVSAAAALLKGTALDADATSFAATASAYFKVLVQHAAIPESSDFAVLYEFYRSDNDTDPQKGFTYAATMAANMTQIAADLARVGYENLFEYSTTDGTGNTTDGSTAKSLQTILNYHAALDKGWFVRRYATGADPYAMPRHAWVMSWPALLKYVSNTILADHLEAAVGSGVEYGYWDQFGSNAFKAGRDASEGGDRAGSWQFTDGWNGSDVGMTFKTGGFDGTLTPFGADTGAVPTQP